MGIKETKTLKNIVEKGIDDDDMEDEIENDNNMIKESKTLKKIQEDISDDDDDNLDNEMSKISEDDKISSKISEDNDAQVIKETKTLKKI